MTKTAVTIGCGGEIGGAWIAAALHALAEQTGSEPAEADVLQGTSAGAEIAAVRARGQRVVPIVPTAAELAGLGANFMNRARRRAAFQAAMTSAPNTVCQALEADEADTEIDV